MADISKIIKNIYHYFSILNVINWSQFFDISFLHNPISQLNIVTWFTASWSWVNLSAIVVEYCELDALMSGNEWNTWPKNIMSDLIKIWINFSYHYKNNIKLY